MKPTVCRIVPYTLNAYDAEEINRRRQVSPDHYPSGWPAGAQRHVGNVAQPGQVLPMVIVRVWTDTCVNGQVLLDGNDSLWVTSRCLGSGEGFWAWPERVA